LIAGKSYLSKHKTQKRENRALFPAAFFRFEKPFILDTFREEPSSWSSEHHPAHFYPNKSPRRTLKAFPYVSGETREKHDEKKSRSRYFSGKVRMMG